MPVCSASDSDRRAASGQVHWRVGGKSDSEVPCSRLKGTSLLPVVSEQAKRSASTFVYVYT